ncbi:hypothetical protein DFJ73DRAFT_808080 [Zopfochytrium polystomum]|nr:hypothetical protein DFJ73DRAFT_808080 [Zopfochytrium polystomum]
MTLPDECVGLSRDMEDCIIKNGLFGRVMGSCVHLKERFEACMRVQTERKREENRARAQAAKKRWDDLNRELGIGERSK